MWNRRLVLGGCPDLLIPFLPLSQERTEEKDGGSRSRLTPCLRDETRDEDKTGLGIIHHPWVTFVLLSLRLDGHKQQQIKPSLTVQNDPVPLHYINGNESIRRSFRKINIRQYENI